MSPIFAIKGVQLTKYIYKWSLAFFAKTIDPPISPIQKFISTNTDLFVKTLDNTEKSYNDNINACFYNKLELDGIIGSSPINDLEKQWGRRVLFNITPYGNIIMMFSPYKMGFEYYSDTRSIPYNILNAMSMKYCLLYKCRDFFVDNSITTDESKHSPLIPIHFLDKPSVTKNKDNINQIKTTTPMPFAKLKNYKLNKKIIQPEDKDGPQYISVSNRFVYLGKICNYSFLQSVPKYNKNSISGFTSNLLDNSVHNDTSLQTNVLNYKAFKLSQKS
jgi:hypothetical protein